MQTSNVIIISILQLPNFSNKFSDKRFKGISRLTDFDV